MSIEELEALRKKAKDINPYVSLKARFSFIEGVDVLIDAYISAHTVKGQKESMKQQEQTQAATMEETRAAYDRAMDACLQEPFK
jgi:hypothetical protein